MNINKTMSSALVLLGLCLITACSGGDSTPATTTAPGTSPPVVANAGPDQSVFIGTFVTLDGSKSTNANGTGLTYNWTLKKPDGNAATLSNPTAVNPSFTADLGGIYEATLVVASPQETSTPDTVVVTASGTNPPPVANAGSNRSVFTGQPTLLDGSGSTDPNGDPLTFVWTISGIPAGSSPTLFDATTVAASFTPDVSGTYNINLIVNDGTSASTPASIIITVSDKPSPTANAGANQFVVPNTALITLNGNSSQTNPSGGNLNFEWTINSSSFSVALNNADTAITTFTPPANTAGTVVAQLKVTEPDHPDPTRNSAIATTMVTMGPLASIKVSKVNPLTLLQTCSVNSCQSVRVQRNAVLQLDGSTSQVQPLSYQWNMTPTTGATLTGTSTNTATFTPGANVTGNFTITLRVTDSASHTDIRSVTISVVTGPIVDSISVTQNGLQVTSVLPNSTAQVAAVISGVTGSSPVCAWPPSSASVVITQLTCTSTSATATIRATQSGSYLPSLTVTDSIGTGTKQFPFYVNTPPTIVSISSSPLSATPRLGCVSVQLSSNVQSPDSFPLAGFSLSWSTNPFVVLVPSSSSPSPRFEAKTTAGYSFSLTATDIGAPPGTGSTTSFNMNILFSSANAGHTLFHNGISNVTNGGCVGCHKAGSHDTTLNNLSATDLNGISSATIFNKLQATTAHTGRLGTGSATQTQADQLAAFFAMTGCLTTEH